MVYLVARILWIVPSLLVLLAANQAKVAYDLRATWLHGDLVMAEVTGWEQSNRADVTYGYVSVRISLPDSTVLSKDKMSLPQSLLPRLKDTQSLAVYVREGAAQEVVIDQLMPAHARIAASNAGISLIGAALFFAGVYWWNTFLRNSGDPGRATG